MATGEQATARKAGWWRDRGLVEAELGRLDEAIADLTAYVQQAEDADDRLAIAERLEELRRGEPPRLH